jgi:hypothetical protein
MPGTIINSGVGFPSAEMLSTTVKETILVHLNIHLFDPD